MDLEILTPCIPVPLMLINPNTLSYVGLHNKGRGLTSKGTHARKSSPSTQTSHVTHTHTHTQKSMCALEAASKDFFLSADDINNATNKLSDA